MESYKTVIASNIGEKMVIEHALLAQIKSLHRLHTSFPNMEYPLRDLNHAKAIIVREFGWTEEEIQKFINYDHYK